MVEGSVLRWQDGAGSHSSVALHTATTGSHPASHTSWHVVFGGLLVMHVPNELTPSVNVAHQQNPDATARHRDERHAIANHTK